MIKEVFDFTMYEIGQGGVPERPVLYSDSLKVSTTEQTAETNEARGGKGNAVLLSWDSNKDITVDIEDALFSAKSMAIMFGDGTVKDYSGEGAYIMKTEIFTAEKDADVLPAPPTEAGGSVTVTPVNGWAPYYTAPGGKIYKKVNPKFYAQDGTTLKDGSGIIKQGEKYFCTYDLKCAGSIIDVGANTFPNSYYCTGDKLRNCPPAA